MAEYIKREEMWEEYQKIPGEFTSHGVVVDAYRVQQAIKTLPTADVEEVVRCKDCKSWGGVVFGYRCRKFSGMNTQIQTSENDFCSFGERKERK